MIEEPKRKPVTNSLTAGAGRPVRAPPAPFDPPAAPHIHAGLYNAPTGPAPKTFLIIDDDAAFRDRLVRALIARGLQAAQPPYPPRSCARPHQPPRSRHRRSPHARRHRLRSHPRPARLIPRIQIVVLTGYGNIATAVEAVRRGAIDYLTKPLDTDQILAAFETAATKSSDAAAELTPSLARVEWEHIQRILTDCNGNISKAARVLGLHRRSLQRKLSKLPPEE